MSLRLKTILGVALIEAVLLAILLSLTLNYLQTTNYEGMDQRASSTARLFASTVKNAVLSYDLATVESFTQELLNNKDIVYVAVFGEGEQLLSFVGNVPDKYSKQILETSSQAVRDATFDVSAPINESGLNFGSVWIGFDMQRLNQQISAAKNWSMLIVLGEMVLVALFSYGLGAYLTGRLSELKRAANTIASGDRDIELNVKGKDELATVSVAFKDMVDQLRHSEALTQNYQNQLEEANQSLEAKVEKRTKDLLVANKKLTDTNQELKLTQDKLIESEKMASIGTMAAGVAHEINNPMGSLSSNLQLSLSYLSQYNKWNEKAFSALDSHLPERVKSELLAWHENNHIGHLAEDFQDSVIDAQKSAERVKNIVSALQQYSSHNYAEKEKLTGVEIDKALQSAYERVELPKNVNVDIQSSIRNMSLILGIPTDIEHLFYELLKNAVQSCVLIATDTVKKVSVVAKEKDGRLAMQVLDEGTGIAPQMVKRIFDPFYTTLPVGEGMGLGLTYAYDIMKHHGGRITVANREEGGVVVSLVFERLAKG